MTKQYFYIAGLLFLAWLLFNLSAALWVDPSSLVKALSAGLFCLTLYRPAVGIGLFLVIMPFFGGSKPGDPHTIHFLGLLTVLNLGLCLWLLLQVFRAKQSLTLQIGHPMVFTVAIYWLVALLSLSTVTTDGQLSFLLLPDPLEAYGFLAMNEAHKIYSWQAWIVLGESLLLGFFLYNLSTTNQSLAMRWTFCVLAGLLVSIVLGVLDFYNLINLSTIRPAFHLNYGAAERHARLASLFGNSGWYAQFVTLATPAVLSILTLSVSRRGKFLLLIGIMSLTEFTLILAYQRGGWISYPLTLLVVWFCIYVLDEEEQSASEVIAKAKGSLKKVLISIPVTIILTLSLVYGLARLAPTVVPGVDSYVQRAAQIQNVEARTVYWDTTAIMLRNHPVIGSGNESFAYQFGRMYLAKDAKYVLTEKQRSNDIQQGSAHNMYFQALAGKGTLGLLSLLAVMVVSASVCWSLAFTDSAANGKTRTSLRQRLVLMMGLSFTAALAIYGNVGEMFYTPINYILFVFFYALVVREVPIARGLSKRRQLSILAAVLLVFVAHLIWEYGYSGASRDALRSENPTGCFDVEGDAAQPAAQYRWCSRRFSVSAPVTVINDQAFAMLALAPNIPARDSAFTVKVSKNGRLLLEKSIDRGIKTSLWVPLPADTPFISKGDGTPDRVELDVQTNDSFIPSLLPARPASSDSRNLSVQWFFNKATDADCFDVEGNPAQLAAQYRWCSRRFSMSAPITVINGQGLAMLALAPNIPARDFAFTVKVSQNGRLLLEKSIHRGMETSLWVPLPADTPLISKGDGTSDRVMLDVQTNDSFIPSLLPATPASSDSRNLSVQWFFNRTPDKTDRKD